MNCNDFETVVTDLARDRVLADARDRALAHAADCRRCAARWRDEQRLTAGLRELAATFNEELMPAGGEAKLLAAFRAQHKAAPASAPSSHGIRWAAAAAVIIVLIALAVVRFTESHKPQPIAEHPQPQEKQSTPAPPRDASNAPGPEHKLSAPPREQAVASPRRKRPGIAPSQKASDHATDASLAAAPAPNANPTTTNGDEQASEIATSFIPLAEGRGLAPADSLQLVRVELPRSALVSFGLPMNVERADQRIKADVLVGNDGIARAIRFVR